jgi:hypothetical protein
VTETNGAGVIYFNIVPLSRLRFLLRYFHNVDLLAMKLKSKTTNSLGEYINEVIFGANERT